MALEQSAIHGVKQILEAPKPIRAADAEREEYRKAAERAGIPLSEWIRDRLSKAAKRESKRD